jgi:cell pole-organizing protein PopZ
METLLIEYLRASNYLPSDGPRRAAKEAGERIYMMDIEAMRQDLKEEFEREAEWCRAKAEQYPPDTGNLEAAETYDRLAATVGEVPADLIAAYWKSFDELYETEMVRRMLNDVFDGTPSTATEFVREFVSRINVVVGPAG